MIFAWKVVNPTPAEPVVEERNPYYWQVDTEGNQLPYIDKIEYSLFDNNDVLNLRVAGGQIDMQQRAHDGRLVYLLQGERGEGQVSAS